MAPIVVYTFARSAPCRSVVMVCRNLGLDIEVRMFGEKIEEIFISFFYFSAERN